MSYRQPLTRVRVADLVVGALLGGMLAAVSFSMLGWLALVLVPLGSLARRFSRGSFERMDRQTEKEITISLDLDPKPDDKDPNGGAA